VNEAVAGGLKHLRELGVQNGADYVVWGSLTRIGTKFSLDTKLLESFEKKAPRILTVEGEGIGNLLGVVKKLGNDLTFTIFKREKVAAIEVVGNRRIEADAIKRVIQTKPGNIYTVKNLSEDLKRVYQMGFFEDVRVESESTPKGKVVTFQIIEKSTIRRIRFKGNVIYDDEDLQESLDIQTGSILNIFKIRSNLNRIENLYREKNYHNVQVTYQIDELKRNQADLEFIIKEGEKQQIKQIKFEGNTVFDDGDLKDEITSSEKGFFSIITSSGEMNEEQLSQDVDQLTAFYQNNGYLQAKVGEPVIVYKGKWIYITFKIQEGRRFKVGKVDIAGDVILPLEELKKKLKISQQPYFSRELVRKDVITLSDLYSDKGYAYAQINPDIKENEKDLVVHITYDVKKGEQVYFEKIIIAGNKKTRDKVIRRELKVYEQELFSGRQLKRSIRNLYRMDYFEDVQVKTEKGSAEDKMNLKIDVTEKSTGSFSIGAGYSSVEDIFASASVTQRNLFGRGQTLSLKAIVGGRSDRYTLSFTEPWLFEIPLSGGFDIYRWKRNFDTYEKLSTGGKLRTGYLVYDDTRAYLSYTYDISTVEDVEEDAPDGIKEMEGDFAESSVSGSLRYDSRNRIFNPTEGSEHRLTIKYAGLGGDISFTKYTGKTGWYFPIAWNTVGFVHAKAGYVTENPDGFLPLYERFYLGGINSLRGFEWRSVGPRDEKGAEIGGDKFVQFNLEYLIPLFLEFNIFGVVFFDTGNAYDNDENVDLGNMRESAGGGVRWYSPVGPIRLEYGYILDRLEGEPSGRWEFSMSTGF
jgi:outer membrane protein insertion porin family